MIRPKLPFEELSTIGKWSRLNFEKHPERYQRHRRKEIEYNLKNKDKINKKKRETAKKRWVQAMNMLGDKCESCGEKYNPKLKRTNLEIHHFYYDKKDKEKLGKIGSLGEIFRDVLKMAKHGKNPKKKYTLLCHYDI